MERALGGEEAESAGERKREDEEMKRNGEKRDRGTTEERGRKRKGSKLVAIAVEGREESILYEAINIYVYIYIKIYKLYIRSYIEHTCTHLEE